MTSSFGLVIEANFLNLVLMLCHKCKDRQDLPTNLCRTLLKKLETRKGTFKILQKVYDKDCIQTNKKISSAYETFLSLYSVWSLTVSVSVGNVHFDRR